MPKFRVTGPDGNLYVITAPEDATPDQVMSYVKQQVEMRPEKIGENRPKAKESFAYKPFEEKMADVGQFLLNESPVIAGATVGGMLGGIPGAVVGGSGGEALKQLGQRAGVLSGEPPQTGMEAAKEIGLSGLFAGAGEGIGRAGIGALQKFLAPFSKSMKPGGEEAIETLAQAGKGLVVPPAKATENWLLDVLDNVASKSFTGGGPMRRMEMKIADYVDDMIKTVKDSFGGPSSNIMLGKITQDAIEQTGNTFRAAAQSKYKLVDDLLSQASGTKMNFATLQPEIRGVNISSVKQKAASILSELQRTGVKNNELTGVFERIIDGPDIIAFQDASSFRSLLINPSKTGTSMFGNKMQGASKEIGKQMDEAINGAGKDLPEGVLEAYRDANKFWREGREVFDDKVIQRIVRSDPDVAGKLIVSQPAGRAELITRLRKAVGDDDVFKAIQGDVIDNWLAQSFNPETQFYEPRKLLKQMETFGGRGGEALTALFPKGEAATVRKLTEAKELVFAKNPTGGGGVFIQLTQAGAAGGLFASGKKLAAGGILVGPYALAKMFTNPKIAKWLSTGYKVGAKTGAAIRTVSQFTALLAKENIPYELINDVGKQIKETQQYQKFKQMFPDMSATQEVKLPQNAYDENILRSSLLKMR